MHAHCAVACKSCDRPIDDLDPEEQHYGDWKYTQQKRSEQKAAMMAYIEFADEDDLVELEKQVESRREKLADKSEL